MVPDDNAGGRKGDNNYNNVADVWVAFLMDDDKLGGARSVYVGCRQMANYFVR